MQAHLDLPPTQRAAAAHRGAAEAMAEHARVAALEHQKALQGTSFSFEGTSLDWQRFARAWNAIVQSLRQRDMLSQLERDELLFFSLGGPQQERLLNPTPTPTPNPHP